MRRMVLEHIPRMNFNHRIIMNGQYGQFIKKAMSGKCDDCGKYTTELEYLYKDLDNKKHIERFCSYDCLRNFDGIMPILFEEITIMTPWIETIQIRK